MHQYNSNSNCSFPGDSAAFVRCSNVLLDPLFGTFELFVLFAFAERLLLFTLDELFAYELLIFFRRPVVLCSFAFGGGGIVYFGFNLFATSVFVILCFSSSSSYLKQLEFLRSMSSSTVFVTIL